MNSREAQQDRSPKTKKLANQQQPFCDEVELPANRSAYAFLKNETGRTTHSILRIASWIAEIGGSIKRKIPLRDIVAVIRDANPSIIFRVEIAVRTLSHRWDGCKNGPAEKAGRDGSFCNRPHGAFLFSHFSH